MIVLLTEEASSILNFLTTLNSDIQGILIGHKRGNTIIVEKIISLGSSLPSPEQILTINKLLENKLTGFFTFKKENENPLKELLIPLNAGHILLRIKKLKKKNNYELKAYLIDLQENRMVFSPLEVKML